MKIIDRKENAEKVLNQAYEDEIEKEKRKRERK